jgi:hypothetical protein
MMNNHPTTGAFVPFSSVAGTEKGFLGAAVVTDARGIGDDGRRFISNPDTVSAVLESTSRDCNVASAAVSAGRSELDDWRTSLHEGGHCVVGRVTGQDVAGCTIVPGDGFGGLTWGPLFDRSMLSNDDKEVPDLCEAIAGLMPGPGEPRVNAAEVYAFVHARVIDLCAGTAAETLLHPDYPPWVAHSDIRQARSLASIICTSENAIDAYLKFASEEAKALITTHRAAVLAIAEALMIHRTLDSTQIDNIIAQAMARETMRIEIERRTKWRQILANATERSAGQES